jgi:hypothetical protein
VAFGEAGAREHDNKVRAGFYQRTG